MIHSGIEKKPGMPKQQTIYGDLLIITQTRI